MSDETGWSARRPVAFDSAISGSRSGERTSKAERPNDLSLLKPDAGVQRQMAQVDKFAASVLSSPESKTRLQTLDELFASAGVDLLAEDLLDSLF